MDENSGLPGTDDRTGQGSRRALLAAGTTAALGAVGVALARPAEAAAGQALLLGRSNTSGTSATAVSSSTTGTAFGVTATAGHGLVGVAKLSTKFGILGRNDATTVSSGGAILGDGRTNVGVVGRCTNRNNYAIAAVSSGTAGGNSGGLLANGGANFGVAAFTSAPAGANDRPALYAQGGASAWAGWMDGDLVVDGALFAQVSLVAAQAAAGLTYREVVSGETPKHTESGRVALDAAGNGTVTLSAGFLAAANLSLPSVSVQLTAMGTGMPNLAATVTATGISISGGAPNGDVSWSVSAPRHVPGAPLAAGVAARGTTRVRPTGTAPRRLDAAHFGA